MLTTSLSLSLAWIALQMVTAQYLPNSQALTIQELQHLYLDADPHGLLSAITPCSNYFDPSTGASNNALGRQSAAEWIRTAFHDMITANIYTQTGGLDASIGFETSRPENVGPAFDDALTFFGYFVNSKVSASDLIALGTVMAVGACGGPHVEFRAGRIDATSAGGTGTPQPETDIQDTLTFASNAGFNTDDFIALTVCGHSMGGVHKAQFPQVFPDNYSGSLDGSDGRDDFDETDATFDNTVASDYVSSSGDKGGPLVTTSNVTVQSDLRLYSQDQNATIERMAGSDSYFESQCQSLFQRMIETVPGSTRLINPAVDPTSTTNLQPYDVSLSVDWAGNMELSGTFRYVQVSGATAAPSSLTVTLIDRDNDTTTTSTTADASGSDTGTGIWGPTSSYDFKLDFPASTGLGGVTAGGTTFNFQDTMFVDSSLSSVSPSPPAFAPGPGLNSAADYTINTTVAYLTTSPPTSLTATFSIPQPGNGSPAPTIDTSTTTTLSLIGTANGYAFYSGLTSKSLSGSQAYGTSVDVAVTGSAAGAMFFKPFGIV